MSAVPLRKNRDFVLFQGGQLLSNIGTQSTQIAYPLLVLALTHSPAKAGIVAFARALPVWLFALPAGLVADRVSRKRLMIASDVVRAAAMAALGVGILLGRIVYWEIPLIAFVEGAGSAFFGGATMAALRAVVPKEQLPAATNVLTARFAAVRLAGPPLGGVLFGVARSIPFLADAASYAFSSASLAAMRTPFQEEREPEEAAIGTRLVEGMRFLWASPFLRTVVLLFSLTQIIFPGAQLALVVIAKRQGLSSAVIGGLIAASGAALLLGSAIAPILRRLLPTWMLIVLEMWTWAGCALFVAFPSVYVLAASMLPTMLAIPTTDSVVWPFQMALTPDRLMGRTVAAITTLTNGMGMLAPLLAGFLLANVSPRATVAVLAAFGLTLAVWGTLSPSIRAAPSLEEL